MKGAFHLPTDNKPQPVNRKKDYQNPMGFPPTADQFRALFRKKSIAELEKNVSTTHALKRVLGTWELIFLGIGAVVGTGIFVITGIAAADYAGPGVVLSFVIPGTAAIFAAA